MKRFYKQATTGNDGDGFSVLLDGRPIRTPARHALLLPTEPLAEAVASEWQAQGEIIEPATMPLTQLASTALDRIAPDPAVIAANIARFAETDLVCYRVETPETLVQRQFEAWAPLVAWLEERFAAKLVVTTGIQPVPQSATAIAAIQAAVAGYDSFRLAALSSIVANTGSIVIGLALIDGKIGSAKAAAAAHVDETFQMERWGSDAELEARLERVKTDLEAAERFLGLI